METLESVFKILEYKRRKDLADLLRKCRIEFNISNNFGKKALYSHLTRVEAYSSIDICETLRALSPRDIKLIIDSFLEIFPARENDMEIYDIDFYIDPHAPTVDNKEIIKNMILETEAQRNLMISVSTGGPRINSVNEEYKERYLRIRAMLSELGIEDPNPYSDLWAWYGKWSSGDLPSYQSRRDYIRELYQPLLDMLNLGAKATITQPLEPTGWARVDRNVDKIVNALEKAKNEEDFQAVALLCREAIISLAQAVYNPEEHRSLDGVMPSPTDAKRMLENYIAETLKGESHDYQRKFAKAAFDLAVNLQHRRTAIFRDAALCVEATRSLINVIAIISGKRDPQE